MARRRGRSGSNVLNTTAENIGAAMAQVAARIESWKKQRAEIAADMHKIFRSAQDFMGEVGDVAGNRANLLLALKPKGKGGRPKGYKMSEATKRKLRAAWKRRKEATKAAQ